MTERSHYPNIAVNLTARLLTIQGQLIYAPVQHIYPCGLMLHGDQSFKSKLLNHHQESHNTTINPIEIQLSLPLSQIKNPLKSRCRLCQVRRLSEHEFEFELRFIELSSQSMLQLERFIGSCSDSNGVSREPTNKSPSVSASA